MIKGSDPTLSDGTKVSDLINLKTREVSLRTLSDPELYVGTADDIKAQRRDEDYKRTAPEREQVRVLREAEAKAKVFYRGLLTTKLSDGTKVSDYLDQEGGSWSSLFGNTRFSQVSRLVSKKLQEFLSSGVQVGRVQVALTEEEKEVFSEAKIGPNWRDSVEKILEDERVLK